MQALCLSGGGTTLSDQLVRYEQMRIAVEQCARIDEAAEIRDKSAALQAYARQREDRDLEVWTAEIKLRASVRVGELVRDLDRAQHGGANGALKGGSKVRASGLSKDVTIEDAGLSRTSAYAYQQIAGPRDEQAQKAGHAAAELYYAKARSMQEPATMEGLREVVQDAVRATVAPTSKHVRGTLGTGENEWYTPIEFIEAARDVLGDFDLDPASSDAAQEDVRASRFFSIETNGLEQEWNGRVWLNPPYAQPAISHFAEKMVAEVQSGRVTSAIMLTHNYTDTAWFQRLANAATAICFTRGRVRFVSPSGELAAPTQGQAFFYFGSDLRGFSGRFRDVGFVAVIDGGAA